MRFVQRKLVTPLLLLFCLLFGYSAQANEGMWLPFLLGQLNEAEMQEMGMKMTAEDIYSVNKGSLKDAIVHFGGFCTGEIISDQGLILTNHHCGYGAIQSHTTLENNYLEDGFWAMTKAAEKPNEGLFVTFLESMEDVTEAILQGIDPSLEGKARQSAIDKAIDARLKLEKTTAFEKVVIKSFFHGNQYILIRSVDYPDVRLVGAPPSSIGKYGADTDNWVWPRHTGDFSLFRVYSDKDGNPAEYSPDNVPYEPKHFLPVSMDGVAEDDFTMIFGYPGRTDEYLPHAAIDQIQESIDPIRISMRDRSLAIMDKYMRQDPEVKIKYASKFASIANGWKKWIGEVQGLKSTNAIQRKKDFEAEYTARAGKSANPVGYVNTLQKFNRLYTEIIPYAAVREYYYELYRNIEAVRQSSIVRGLVESMNNEGEPGFIKAVDKLKPSLSEFYKNYRPDIDQEVFASLIELVAAKVPSEYMTPELTEILASKPYAELAADIYDNSYIPHQDKMEALLAKAPQEALAGLQGDALIQFMELFRNMYAQNVAQGYDVRKEQMDDLKREYMAAQLELFPEKTFYPDANSTMRVTYGQAKGYEPRDAVRYEHITYLDGIVAKYVPGDYEFDLPAKMLELHATKDFGPYADDTGDVPVCFIGTNHTSGGNSGSPAIDAHGNLIGLNFDRVWEGTMSDVNYDPSICRNIMVDARYILFVVDKFANAGHLVDEMKLVYPKTKKKSK